MKIAPSGGKYGIYVDLRRSLLFGVRAPKKGGLICRMISLTDFLTKKESLTKNPVRVRSVGQVALVPVPSVLG